jgi:3-phenylpropionate/cinnamic acid dioxygenase small subunit
VIGDPRQSEPAPASSALDTWWRVSHFLALEAALLDERRFDEWLDLYTEDAVYWVPIRPDQPSPTRDVSINYDDRARLRERVGRLSSEFAHAQNPPSRTCHVVGNVRVGERTADGIAVTSTFVVTEVRRGVQTVYSGFVEHELVERGDTFGIRQKRVRLLNSDLPLGNLTFIL